jgi:hypothetical protein
MKQLAILVLAFGTLAANAQVTTTDRLLESAGGKPGKQTSTLSFTAKKTEITKGNVAYNGLAVQAVKVGNPLQLFNPLAPPRYGSAEDNLSRDPISGRASGLKIFSIRF